MTDPTGLCGRWGRLKPDNSINPPRMSHTTGPTGTSSGLPRTLRSRCEPTYVTATEYVFTHLGRFF
jgi:hypothetical protein